MKYYLTTLASLLLAQLALAGAPCRDYELIDNDSGEHVTGCASLRVESTGGGPIQVVPALKSRVRFGWKIAELSRGDLLSRMGLRPGDVILSLNGYEMAAQETPNVIAEVLGSDDKLVVTVGTKPRSTPAPATIQVVQMKSAGTGLTLQTAPSGFLASIGVRRGDTLLSIAGQPVTDSASLARLESQAKNMSEVHVVIKRDGSELDLLVKTK